MNVIQVILHLGSIIRVVEDGDKLFNDLVHKAPVGTDATQTLSDIGALIASGAVPMPVGMTIDAVQQMIADLKGVL